MQDMKPGVYAGISNADYHGGPGISKSGLDLIRRSPLHYLCATMAANDDPTPDQMLGTAFHSLLLEPEAFARDYTLPLQVPEGALATVDDLKARLQELGVEFKASAKKGSLVSLVRQNDPKAVILDDLKAAWREENAGRQVLTQEVWDQLHAMRDAVLEHPVAGALMKGGSGLAEQSVYWHDPETGELCRCRPDWWRTDLDVLVDVKTTNDASPEGFSKSLVNFRYHVQAPFYLDGVERATGQRPRAFLFLAVEKKPPYAVAVYQLDPESMSLGAREYREDLQTYANCKRTGVWPGYGDRIQLLGVPQWYLVRAEREAG